MDARMVHQVRNTLKYVADKGRKAFAKSLRTIYNAPSGKKCRKTLGIEDIYPFRSRKLFFRFSVPIAFLTAVNRVQMVSQQIPQKKRFRSLHKSYAAAGSVFLDALANAMAEDKTLFARATENEFRGSSIVTI